MPDLEFQEEDDWWDDLDSEDTILFIPSDKEDEPEMEEDWWDDSRGAYSEVDNVDFSSSFSDLEFVDLTGQEPAAKRPRLDLPEDSSPSTPSTLSSPSDLDDDTTATVCCGLSFKLSGSTWRMNNPDPEQPYFTLSCCSIDRCCSVKDVCSSDKVSRRCRNRSTSGQHQTCAGMVVQWLALCVTGSLQQNSLVTSCCVSLGLLPCVALGAVKCHYMD
ncbi:uncharacterized protein LOC114437825 [Parambassis ranga]|uniref:Uncharacterized protein LOC114437825 n=1 Tax=Parambassis ranga TaxID=210632 RepID=A0A6P7IN17_9TELE|nr:uncharacterized protein LOC114437825 [Parambassis ranga]